jgi:hypothetical protein
LTNFVNLSTIDARNSRKKNSQASGFSYKSCIFNHLANHYRAHRDSVVSAAELLNSGAGSYEIIPGEEKEDA